MTPPRMIREIAAIIPFVWKEECLRCEAGGGGNWQPDEPGCCPKGLGNFPSGAEDSESGQGGKSGTVCFWRGDGTGPAEEAAGTHTVGGGGNESFAGLIRFEEGLAVSSSGHGISGGGGGGRSGRALSCGMDLAGSADCAL